ncbi:HupE/UreJ family protein [Aurantiacibacter luteus]|uniref:HupE/UreJ family protein n=1 Tax=Aurantiacibacter luteus TaxID=1581420 RepID=UPI00069AF01A|nr:HupE/UreJ family protein [Aurantiacibacter luteus]
MHADLLADELGFDKAHDMLDSGVLEAQDSRVRTFLARSLSLTDGDGRRLALLPGGYAIDVADGDVDLRLQMRGPPPAELHLSVAPFPGVEGHQAFVSLRDRGRIVQQFMLAADKPPQVNYAGTAAGAWAVIGTFLPSGAWHGLFGLVHSFGFVFVLREFGLPPGNLAVSLLAFNLGVELGQLAIVVPVALMLAAIRRRDACRARWIAKGGSLAVVAAGLS